MSELDDRRREEPDHDDRDAVWVGSVKRFYHAPGAVPRDAMWAEITERLRQGGTGREVSGESRAPGERDGDRPGPMESDRVVLDLQSERDRRRGAKARLRPMLGWGAAAAAVLVVGIGIGRTTAPSGGGSAGVPATAVAPEAGMPGSTGPGAPSTALELASRRHLARTEPLLTMVRADARSGRLDPGIAPWARSLLGETRMLMDAREAGEHDELGRLLSDLEFVLIQIMGASEGGAGETSQSRTELELAVRSLEDQEMLRRIQAAAPVLMAGS